MEFANSTLSDINFAFQLFDSAIAYQKNKGYDLWPQFSREMIEADILENRHWKVIEDGKTMCIFSVMYSDPVIWGEERNKQPAVYLHRIAIKPEFKGRKMIQVIRNWAIEHAKSNNKQFVKMDSWGNNKVLRNYYISCGFPYIGQQLLKNTEVLPGHYGGNVLSLFQIEVNK